MASLFPLDTCPPVSDEEFNLFHSGDRRLYSRLIGDLGRDPSESMQVMSFWMWLELAGNDKNLVKRMLSLPFALLNELAEETVMCLNCVENDRYPFGDGNDHIISLLPDIVSSRISLRHFHDNRIGVLRGVTRVMNSICGRALGDILERAIPGNNSGGGCDHGSRMPFWPSGSVHDEVGESSMTLMMMPVFYNPFMDMPFLPLPHHQQSVGIPMPPPVPLPPLSINHPTSGGEILSNELGEMLSRNLNLREEKEVPADDRTIFLTFSKGYPISEDEVREYFTRRFGDFIEDIFMQEVSEGEQPLFARLVVRSGSIMNTIVGGSRAKYTINGKHVWARKYVKKQTQQQPTRQP